MSAYLARFTFTAAVACALAAPAPAQTITHKDLSIDAASMGSVVVFRNRNSISAAPNILFTSMNDNVREGRAALCLDLTRTLDAFALHAGLAAHTHRSHHNLRRRNRQGKQMSVHRYNDHITLHTSFWRGICRPLRLRHLHGGR